jgi:hypothetical protein
VARKTGLHYNLPFQSTLYGSFNGSNTDTSVALLPPRTDCYSRMGTTFGDPTALANTYDPPADVDGWEIVQQYQEVMEFAADHPNLGSGAVANRLGLPRGRIRPWMEDDSPSVPDVVRGVRTAERHGWIDMDADEQPFRTINRLVAWVFSNGSLNERNYLPRFSASQPSERDRIDGVLRLAGVGSRVAREFEPGRGAEVEPEQDQCVLGRLLATLGAPVGKKGPKSDLELPSYLAAVSRDRRREFARTYVRNRGTFVGKPTAFVQIKEQRTPSYRKDLTALLGSTTEGSVRHQSSGSIHLDSEAVGDLFWRNDDVFEE